MQALLEKFEYAEVIFGCEDIVDNNVAAIMAVEGKMVELITKNKSANLMARLMKEDKLKLYVSRDSKLHEKVFVLKAKDGFEEGYRISTRGYLLWVYMEVVFMG